MDCKNCKGTGKATDGSEKPCFLCNGIGSLCDECGEATEDIYRLDEYPEGQWLEVGLTGINGKRVGEMEGLQVRRPIKPEPGKLYSGTIIDGRLDLSVIPPEVSEAERTLYKFFSQRGNNWRFWSVASRDLVEKMEEDSRHFAEYGRQIDVLRRMLAAERDKYAKEISEDRRPHWMLTALFESACVVILTLAGIIIVWAGAKAAGFID